MSIESTDREFTGRHSKSKVFRSVFGDLDLLNYTADICGESAYHSESDKSSGNLDLLLKPCEIERLVCRYSNDGEYTLLNSPSGVAKKPGFFLKQDMKTVSQSKVRNHPDGSDCILETLLPKVPSRCRKKYSSHKLLRRDSDNGVDGVCPMRQTCRHRVDTEDDSSHDEGSKYIFQSSHDLFSEVKNHLAFNCNNPRSLYLKEDLLSDEWLHSLNPRVFCRKRENSDPAFTSDNTLLRKDVDAIDNVKQNSLNDLTLPFYRLQRKVQERDVEKDLLSLGFANDTEVNWNALYSPKRRDVLRLIHYRLCNHIGPDIIVVLDDKEFFCHRILLQSYSEYFDDLKNSDSNPRVDITDMNITENAFLTIYTWMLTVGQGGFQLLTTQNILEVLLACQILRIKEFEKQCVSFLENGDIFKEESAYFLFKNAVELKMNRVRTMMVPRIKNFFLILVSSKDYLDLSAESVVAFLDSDNIAVNCELEIFYSAIRWLNHSADERRDRIPEILNCVRFGLMTPLELVDLRKTNQSELADIISDPAVQRAIDEGLAVAVKNTLGRSNGDATKATFVNEATPRVWLGKSKSYKCYRDFLEFLKEIKSNPKSLLHPGNNEIRCSDVSKGKRREDQELRVQISRKSLEESIPLLDSTVVSKTSSGETKMQYNLLTVSKNDMFDASTNTCLDYRSDNLTHSLINDLIKCKLKDTYETEEDKRCPVSKLSEPVIQTLGCSARPTLREQAATVLQAAIRGHITRVRLLKALTKTSHQEACREKEPTFDKPSPSACVDGANADRSCSYVTVPHLNSETKLQEELTKSGSTFHLFQNSILVFGGLDPNSDLGPGNSCTDVYKYSPEKNKWELFGNMPEPRYYHDVAILKGRVYLAGGVDPEREDLEEKAVCKTVWSMDPVTGQWRRETDMLTERKNFGLVTAGGYLYAIGGYDNACAVLSSVERYDASLKKWSYVANLEHARTGAAVCKHNHMIWVAGGISAPSKHQVIKQVECYDPKRDVWMAKSPLRFGRAFGRLVSLKGNLYLAGGASKRSSTAATSTPSIDIWDERNKEWKLKTEMSIPRHNHSVAFVGSQMVILGGTTTMSMRCVTTVESWCVNRGTWIRGIASLPAPLIGHSAVTLPLDVY